MYEVVIVACLVAQPAECRTFRLRPQQYADVLHCSRAAPLHVTRWGMRRTNWQIKKWTCAKKVDMI